MKKIDLADIGFFAGTENGAGEGLIAARISAQYRGQYTVMTQEGEMPAKVAGKLRFGAEGAEAFPAVGDNVLVRMPENPLDAAVIQKILPRKSCLARKAAGTAEELQVIAANIDTVFICMSLNRDFNLRRLERYLSVIWDSRAMPVIVLTKSDLEPDIEERLLMVEAAAAGVDILATSALAEESISGLKKYLGPGKTVAFVGSSGVGKSTLINALLRQEAIPTGEIREEDGRGRHTTTHRQMYLLPGGGVVIDTPGMRELKIATADIEMTFADIEALASGCRFSDCRHAGEPGCAVQSAIADGTLDAKRLESYKKLQKEAAFAERKSTMSAAQAEKQKIIGMMGSLKACRQILKDKYGRD